MGNYYSTTKNKKTYDQQVQIRRQKYAFGTKLNFYNETELREYIVDYVNQLDNLHIVDTDRCKLLIKGDGITIDGNAETKRVAYYDLTLDNKFNSNNVKYNGLYIELKSPNGNSCIVDKDVNRWISKKQDGFYVMCSNNCADILRIIDAYIFGDSELLSLYTKYIDTELEFYKKYNFVVDHRINK
jgi:hypothetical protein